MFERNSLPNPKDPKLDHVWDVFREHWGDYEGNGEEESNVPNETSAEAEPHVALETVLAIEDGSVESSTESVAMQDAYQEPVDAAPSLLDSRKTSVSDDEPSQINLSPASHLSPSPPDVPCMSSSPAGAKRAAGDDDDSDVRERLLMAKMARMRTSCFFCLVAPGQYQTYYLRSTLTFLFALLQ